MICSMDGDNIHLNSRFIVMFLTLWETWILEITFFMTDAAEEHLELELLHGVSSCEI